MHRTIAPTTTLVAARFTARALFRDEDGRVLLLERAGTGSPRWSLPGGAAREDESVPVACQRRVRKATGLTAFVPSRVLVVHHLPDAEDVAEHVTMFDGGVLDAGAVTPGGGCASHRWVTRGALEEFLPAPAVREATAALGHLDAFTGFRALLDRQRPDASGTVAYAAETLAAGVPCLAGPALG